MRISVIAKHHGRKPICRTVDAGIDNEFHQDALLASDRMFVIGLNGRAAMARPSVAGALYRPGKAARRRPRPYSDLARNQKMRAAAHRRERSRVDIVSTWHRP
jgi:hypothetical protein